MTAQRKTIELSKEERLELDDLFFRIKANITCFTVHEFERFTDLFTRTLAGKGDGNLSIEAKDQEN